MMSIASRFQIIDTTNPACAMQTDNPILGYHFWLTIQGRMSEDGFLALVESINPQWVDPLSNLLKVCLGVGA